MPIQARLEGWRGQVLKGGHGVGCVGQLICIYPCVPHNSSWQIQTGPVKGQKGCNSIVRPLISLFQLLCYNLPLLS